MFDNSQIVRHAPHRASFGAANLSVARREAAQLFWKAFALGQWRRLWRTLRGQTNRLTRLTSSVSQSAQRIDLGLQAVPLAQIKGSEGRSSDFDVEFLPSQTHSQDRWINVAAAWRSGQPLPPVELIQVGDTYFVRDGHHRLSVARLLGQATIDAQVTLMR